MSRFTDQLEQIVEIPCPPQRIVSLVPSQTELLCYLGLKDRLLGVTKFCVHPADLKEHCSIIGGTKNLNLDKIAALQPDLIIGNKEENQKEQIEELRKNYPLWMSDISNLDEALDMINAIGRITDREKASQSLQEAIKQNFRQLSTKTKNRKVAYLIWQKPYMVAASDTFIDDMLHRAGFINVFRHQSRYPQISEKELSDCPAEFLFLSSEPYPFQAKHQKEIQQSCPGATVILVDGELFSWYGNRLLHSAGYFAKLQSELFKS